MTRKSESAQHNARYKMARLTPTRFSLIPCFYCGDPADTVDHHPPLSRVSDYQSLNTGAEEYIKVRCCRECNTLAGNSLQMSLDDRAAYVKNRIATKYKKVIASPSWGDDEIAEMGVNLRRKIRALVRKKESIERRLAHQSVQGEFKPVVSIIYQGGQSCGI